VSEGGWTDQAPVDWLNALRLTLSDLAEDAAFAKLGGVVFTGQMSAALLVDRNVDPLTRCLIWSDQRAALEAAHADKISGSGSIYRVTGNPPSATYTAPKLAWLKTHAGGAAFDRAAAFLQPKDWLVGRLTGRIVTDPSDASCTNLFDLKNGCWDAGLFRLFGIPIEMAPEIVPSATIIGPVLPQPGAMLGLPSGLPVIVGGGDGPMTAVGNGVVASGQGYTTLGTSAWVSFATASPRMDPSSGLATFAHVVPGLFVETGSMQAAGASLEWVARLFGLTSAQVAEIALALPPPSDTAPIFLPYLLGERTPYWSAHPAGTLFGLNPNHNRDTVLAAVLEGVLFHLRLLVDHFAALGHRPAVLPVSGGFGASTAFANRLADVLRRPIAMLSDAGNSTAIGAAAVGFLALGVLSDFSEAASWPTYQTPVTPPTTNPGLDARYDVFRLSWPDNQVMTAPLAALVQK
jgi:xylulokinase